MSDNKMPGQALFPKTSGLRSPKRDTSEDVAHVIGCRIVQGMHPSGALLPTEHELCAALGVSRPALREGLRLLGAKGMIVGRRKVGTVVRPRSDWNMLDAAVLAWHLEQEPSETYIRSLFEARMVIEPSAAALAARRAGSDEVDAIATAFGQMLDAQAAARTHSPEQSDTHVLQHDDELTATVAADLRFHVAILGAGGNLFLSSFGALIASSLRAAFRLNWRVHASAPELSLAQHKAVLDAISDKDADRAETCMRILLESASADARQALKKFISPEMGPAGQPKVRIRPGN